MHFAAASTISSRTTDEHKSTALLGKLCSLSYLHIADPSQYSVVRQQLLLESRSLHHYLSFDVLG